MNDILTPALVATVLEGFVNDLLAQANEIESHGGWLVLTGEDARTLGAALLLACEMLSAN